MIDIEETKSNADLIDIEAAFNKVRPDADASNSLYPVLTPNASQFQLRDSKIEVRASAIDRAAQFFVENNENYKVSWEEANEDISLGKQLEDPSRPPVPGCNAEFIRFRCRRIVESIWFRALTMFLILLDLCIVIADIIQSSKSSNSPETNKTLTDLQAADFAITIYFVLEIIFRIAVLTPSVFFSAWHNLVDFGVVSITFVCVVVSVIGSDNGWTDKITILTFFRFVRVVRLVRLYTTKKQLETGARQLISQNKRRYQVDGHDLDLTYVTQRVIATSFPSSGFWAFYRNPIEKVAAFLNEKHPGKYKMYNLCSEKTYDTSHFNGAVVERFMIDDHNVPSLSEMLRFADNVRDWLGQDEENVIVVHCKGGKGRTGTMICVWLIEIGIFTSAEESLDYFGNRRTDTNVGKKFQGVETPSQARYVGYFEKMKSKGGELPLPNPLSISEIRIRGMKTVGKGNGEDFWVEINEGEGKDAKHFSAHFGFNRNCSPSYDAEADLLTIKLINCPKLDGDVRILFQTLNKSVPKGYEKAPLYLWFNTRMINSTSLTFNRDQLDNPHKSKTWKCFTENFSVEVIFSQS